MKLAALLALIFLAVAPGAPAIAASPPPTCVTYLPGIPLATPPPNTIQPSAAAVQAAIKAGTAAAQAAGFLGSSTGVQPPTPSQLAATMKANGITTATSCTPTGAQALASPAPGAGGVDAAAIYAAALAFYGTNTKAAFGARGGWGSEACMLSVNQIIFNALGFYLANDTAYVPDGVSAILAGAGYQISQGQAGPGDIVVADGQGHIGICLDVGCHTVLSNSSSTGMFIWKSDSNFSPSYQGPSTFYRIK